MPARQSAGTGRRALASLRDIAKNAGVSVATVSRTLNNSPDVSEKLRDRVLREAKRAGYAKSEASKRLGRIGLGYPGEPIKPELGGFDASVMSGVMHGVMSHGFDFGVVNLLADKRSSESYTQFFRRKGLDGVVLRTFTGRRHICEEIASEGFPAVVVGDRFEDERVNYICFDSELETAAAVDHLVHLGHERIGLCVHAVPDTDHEDRRRAFEHVLASKGLEVERDLVVEVIADINGGASAINRFMSLSTPPTAIVFTDPLSTVGGLRRALELNIRVPEELSIVGFDDGELRRYTHPIYTAVCGDAADLGRAAAAWLARRIDRGPSVEPMRVRRNAYLEVNSTTAATPAERIRVSPDGRRLGPADRS